MDWMLSPGLMLALSLAPADGVAQSTAARERVGGEPMHERPGLRTKRPLGTGWGLGVSAGITSGFGLSSRRHFNQGLGVQATALYLPLPSEHWLSFGAQGFYTILRGDVIRFYALLGAQLMMSRSRPQTRQALLGRYTTLPSYTWTHGLFTGVGMGLEFHFTRSFGWAIEIPLSVRILLEKPRAPESWANKVDLVPAANTSLMFYFN